MEVKSPNSWSVYVNQSQLCWVTELQHWVEMKTIRFSAWWEIIAATWESSSFRHAFISRPLLIVVTVVTERQSGRAAGRKSSKKYPSFNYVMFKCIRHMKFRLNRNVIKGRSFVKHLLWANFISGTSSKNRESSQVSSSDSKKCVKVPMTCLSFDFHVSWHFSWVSSRPFFLVLALFF